jgi:hypothetical protein
MIFRLEKMRAKDGGFADAGDQFRDTFTCDSKALEAFRRNRKLALDAFKDELGDVAGWAFDHFLNAESR